MNFEKKVKNIPITGRLLSLDVNSLFTKVPVHETINFIRRKLPSMNLNHPFSNNIFVELLELSMTGNVFNLEWNITKNIGTKLVSSLSLVISNIFMKYFDTKLLLNISQKK